MRLKMGILCFLSGKKALETVIYQVKIHLYCELIV